MGTAKLNIAQNARLVNSKAFCPNARQKFKLHIKMLSLSWIAGFFGHQYLQKELISLLRFFIVDD